MSRRFFAAVLCTVMLAPAWAHAQPPRAPESSVDLQAVLHGDGHGLTADAAARRAVATAPSLERAQAAVRIARSGAERALYGFIPQLSLSFRYTRLSEITQASAFGEGPTVDEAMIAALVAGVDDPESQALHIAELSFFDAFRNVRFPVLLDQYGFRATLTVPLSDLFLQVLPAYEGAQEGVRAVEAQSLAQREDVAYAAREAFYNYSRARGALAVAQIALEQAQSRHTQVQAFVAAGTAARVDELRIRAQVAATQVAIARASAGLEVTATAVRTLLHLPPNTRIAVGEDVLAPLPDLPARPDALVARAMQQRDDVRALRHLMSAFGRQADAAEGSRYPHLAVAANLDVANPNSRVFPQTDQFRESWDVSALVTWSLHDLLNGEQQANEARGQRDQAEADLHALSDAVRLSVIEAATGYSAARESLGAAQLGVQAAEESQRVQMERFRAGASTVRDVIDASAEQVRAQLDLVNAATDARIAWARLQRALGTGAR